MTTPYTPRVVVIIEDDAGYFYKRKFTRGQPSFEEGALADAIAWARPNVRKLLDKQRS